ncbi:MAG: Holliday junction resolvase RuvX [Acidimicrobiales bacterium]
MADPLGVAGRDVDRRGVDRRGVDRRSLGVDLGSKRIGVALCDSGGRLATPYELVVRSGQRSVDHQRIAQLVDEVEAVRVIVGLPRSLGGGEGPAAQAVLAEIAELALVVAVPVLTQDERLTTVTAQRNLRQGGLNGVRARKVVDQVAASVLLQAFLDAEQAQDHAAQGGFR